MKKTVVIGIAAVVIVIIAVVLIINFSKKEQIIGGCAGVSSEYLQECCDNLALENNITKIQCVGEWEIKDNQCSWDCSYP